MINLSVRITVADYATFRSVFDANEALRRAHGAIGAGQVYQDLENLNQVTTLVEWDSAEKRAEIRKLPELKEAMQAAGVISAPEVHFLNHA